MLFFTKSIAKYNIFQWFCRHLPTCGELQICGLRIQSRYFFPTPFAWEYSDSSLQVFECIRAAWFRPEPIGSPTKPPNITPPTANKACFNFLACGARLTDNNQIAAYVGHHSRRSSLLRGNIPQVLTILLRLSSKP